MNRGPTLPMRDNVHHQDFTPGRSANVHTRPVRGYTMAELMDTEFPPTRWVVPHLIPEGLTMLASKPKCGKSWMMLGIATASGIGGETLGQKVPQGDALYLALEDTPARLKGRLQQSLGFVMPPTRAVVYTEWPRVDEGGIERMEKWVKSVENPRWIGIDVFVMVRGARQKNGNAYEEDYRAARPLKQFAEMYKVGITIAHHLGKRDSDDPLDMISSTTGLPGACDNILVIRRSSQGTQLQGRGRDISEVDKAIKLDEMGVWQVLGDSAEVMRSDTRKKILAVLDRETEPVAPTEIARATGISLNHVSVLLYRMVAAGEVQKASRGRYAKAAQPHNQRDE